MKKSFVNSFLSITCRFYGGYFPESYRRWLAFAAVVFALTGALFGEEALAPEETEDVYTTEPVYTDYDKVLTVKPAGSALLSAGVEYTDVPVLLRLSTEIPGFKYADFKRSGKDMLILDEESNVLPYEIQVWNEEGESLVWVKTLRYSAVTCLSVYYGDKENRRNAANDPKQVWSAYSGVWHLDELGAEITLADSSPNGYDGNTHNVSKGVENGVLGNYAHCIDKQTESGQAGLYFDGTKNISHGGKLTLSAWVKRYQLNSCWDHLFYSKKGSSEWGGFASEFYGQDKAWGLVTLIGGGSNGNCVRSEHGFENVNEWYHIVVTYDGWEAFYYNNGVCLGGGTMLGQPMWSNGQRFSLGNANDLDGTPWDGAFDEFRVSVGAMSPDRVAIEYALMQEGAMTMTVGDNEGVRLEFGNVSFTSNGDGTFSASASLLSGSASQVKLMLSDGTSIVISDEMVSAPWSREINNISLAANTSFKVSFVAENADGGIVAAYIDDCYYSGTISVSAVADAFEEDLSNGGFVFSRAEDEAAIKYPLVVNYAVSGDAIAGKDYKELSGTITIPAGESKAQVAIEAFKNPVTDVDVSVRLILSEGNYKTSQSSSSSIRIINARDPVFLRFAKAVELTLKEDVDAFTVGKTVTDFPVLVRLVENEGGFSYSDMQRDDHGDIAFYDEAFNSLSYEIELWNPQGESRIWVKVRELKPQMKLWLCYGDDEPVANDPTDVWSRYGGVWHLYGAGEREVYCDSTANRMDAVKTAGRLLVTDPTQSIITNATGHLTVSVWVKPEVLNTWQWIVSSCQAECDQRWGFQFTSDNMVRFWNDEKKEPRIQVPKDMITAGEWMRLDCVYSETTYYLYVNGTLVGSLKGQNWANGKHKVGHTMAIGGLVDTTKNDNLSTAEFGEVRFAGSALPAEWFKATYAFESRNDSCFYFGEVFEHLSENKPAVNSASTTTVDGKEMIAVPLAGGEGRLYIVVRDTLGNVMTNAVTDGVVSAGTYYYPVSSLPLNRWFDIGVYAEGTDGSYDARKYSVTVRNSQERKIAFRASGYTGNPIEGFPALVRLSEGTAGFSYRSLTDEGATPDNIHFQDGDGNELPFEVDAWNKDGESLFWVRMPVLSKGAKIFLVYGVEYTPEVDVNERRASVWNGLNCVYHTDLNTDSNKKFGNSAQKSLDDARGWDNSTAKSEGVAGVGRLISSGGSGDKNRHGMEFGKNDLFKNTFADGSFTVSLWVKYHTRDQQVGYDRIIANKESYNSASGWELSLQNGYPSNLQVRGSSETAVGSYNESETPPLNNPVNDGEWHYLTVVYGAKSVSIYENGEFRISGTIDTASYYDGSLVVGNNSKHEEVDFKGTVDEIRLGPGSLSADRIKADYETVVNRNFFTASPYCKIGMILIVR